MALFPGPDSPAYRAWSAAADVVILNVLTLAGCLPVVTAGASLTFGQKHIIEGVAAGAVKG